MKQLLPGIALLLAFGCADGPELPAVELGGPSGARLMNGQARTPFEAYDNAYASLTRAHYNVRRNLDGRNTNLYGARAAMEQIIGHLETMRSLVVPADQPKFDPYLVKYRDYLKDIDRGTWGGSFLSELDKAEREVKSKLNPATLEIVAAAAPVAAPAPAPAPAPTPVPPPAPRDPAAPIPSDKVEIPAGQTPAAAAPPSAPAPNTPAAPAGVSARIFFKAWERAHDDLVAAYKDKKDCRPSYETLAESLRLLKGQLSGDRAGKLQIYLDYYAGIHEKTRGFAALPEKTAAKDIVDELDVAARVIRKEFNPDR